MTQRLGSPTANSTIWTVRVRGSFLCPIRVPTFPSHGWLSAGKLQTFLGTKIESARFSLTCHDVKRARARNRGTHQREYIHISKHRHPQQLCSEPHTSSCCAGSIRKQGFWNRDALQSLVLPLFVLMGLPFSPVPVLCPAPEQGNLCYPYKAGSCFPGKIPSLPLWHWRLSHFHSLSSSWCFLWGFQATSLSDFLKNPVSQHLTWLELTPIL